MFAVHWGILILFISLSAGAELPPACGPFLASAPCNSSSKDMVSEIKKQAAALGKTLKWSQLDFLKKQAAQTKILLGESFKDLKSLEQAIVREGTKSESPENKVQWEALLESFNNLKTLKAIDRPFDGREEEFYGNTLKMFPILAHKKVLSLASKSQSSMAEIKEVLLKSIEENRAILEERRTVYDGYEERLAVIEKTTKNDNLLSIRMDGLIREYPLVYGDMKNAIPPEDSQDFPLWCQAQERQEKLVKSDQRLEQLVDAGSLAITLFTGVYGRLGGAVLTRAVQSLPRASLRAGVSGLDLTMLSSQWQKKDSAQQQCLQQYNNWVQGGAAGGVENYRECMGSQSAIALIGSAVPLGAALKPLSVNKLKAFKGWRENLRVVGSPSRSRAVLEEKMMPDGSRYTVLDIKEAQKKGDLDLLKHSEAYWNHVAQVYSDKLKKLSPKEVQDFRKTNEEVADRTILISHSIKEAASGKEAFKGGVGVVLSSSEKELLPLEKATGLKIKRSPGSKVAEFMRLTAEEGEKEGLILVRKAAAVASSDKNIDTVYVYTSKIHERLYKSWNVPFHRVPLSAKEASQLGNRDVLLSIDRNQLEQLLKSPLVNGGSRPH